MPVFLKTACRGRAEYSRRLPRQHKVFGYAEHHSDMQNNRLAFGKIQIYELKEFP
jgi:hypothetical protein